MTSFHFASSREIRTNDVPIFSLTRIFLSLENFNCKVEILKLKYLKNLTIFNPLKLKFNLA